MSAKWRALQHRHRYTYSAVVFPSSFTASLSLSPFSSNPNFLPFFTQLTRLISLTSTYSQLTHAKSLASAFAALASSPISEAETPHFEAAAGFYLELMFLENSLPLHRTLVSGLSKVGDLDRRGLIGRCFRRLCEEYGGGDGRKKRFCLSRVALSVMGMPKLGFLVEVVEDIGVLVAWDVVLGLESVVFETRDWARPSPIVMEQCQEALSCLYYLLQRFPGKFKGLNGFRGEEIVVMERVLGVLLRVLKSMAFSRDCFVAAGVSLCAALQVCLSEQELSLVIIEGIFKLTPCSFLGNSCASNLTDAILKIPFKGDLCSEIGNFSVLSRLCLIRGILTAISRTVLNTHFVISVDNLNGHEENGSSGTSIKTILYNGILPELCNYCESPIDSHFNFHALTVLQICLQQVKTSMLSNLTDLSDNYDPISMEMGTRILRIIWNNLEDPLSQTVKQVNLIFDLFLDIQSTLHWGEGGERIKSFLQKIASDLLRLGPRCKGRYIPLASLTKRLGAKNMLDMSDALLFETMQAYTDDDVCCAATTFLKCFLECLRDECWNSDGVDRGYAVYRGYCLPPFLYGLASGVSKLRSNLNTYALPVLLDVDVDSVFPLLAFISVQPSEEENGLSFPEVSCADLELGVEQQVAILVSLLKVCRSLALIEGDIDLCDASAALPTNDLLRKEKEIMKLYAAVCIKGIKVKVHVEWLVLALIHADELLRVDAAETLFLNPKTSSLPSHLELTLLKEAVPLNMRSCSTGFQMKWTSLFRKFFSRVRTALERHFKQGSWQPLMICNNIEASRNKGDEDVVKRAEDLFNFIRWFCCFLFFSCYPSAPYKRKIMAMELILIMLNVWPIVPSSQEMSTSSSPESCLCPYSQGITSPDSTLLLVGSIIDSWDRLRENSFRILLYFPTPLPGISSEDMVQKVLGWAKKLVCSPRVRESDAGALTLRLIFRKYVLDLGWMVRASANVVCLQSQSERLTGDSQIVESRTPVIEYIRSLIDWLNAAVEEGERDLSEACRNSFVHGVLLTLRYTFEELEWNSDAVVCCILEIRHALEKLLELVMRITSLALWVVSADAWYLPDMDEMADDDTYMMDELDVVRPSSECEGGVTSNPKHVQDNRPTEQIVMVGCWLAMKEVSLLLGTIIRKIPLPSSSPDSLEYETPLSDSNAAPTLAISNPMLDLKQLEQIGNHFLEVLLKMKHNGAIDKTRAGFTALCNRLLCSNDPRLCMLTESWMEQLMGRTVAKGQTVDDLLRRSAGIPAAFIALFLSEPEGAPKKLLPRALQWLIGVANGSLLRPVNAEGVDVEQPREPDSEQPCMVNATEKTSKIRDEGVIPTVHAFNVLRAAFNDTNLATDTSGFAAEALIISIRSFSSPYWEVRNSACLAYTALLRRMVGFLNVQKRESARRALTGLEFFHRYTSLHPFLCNELKVATDSLLDATSGSGHLETNLAKVVHPSLCPMLIFLSRLKPSTVASESGDDLDPFLFMPFIRRCSTQSNLRIRVLASRALTSLVSNEKLHIVLLNIASELPCLENQITATSISTNSVNQAKGNHFASSNSIHGILLQLSSLLDANCRNLADFTKKEKILGDLIHVLAMRSWIAIPRWCPCPILNAAFLRVLDHMLSIARTGLIGENFYAIRSLLVELSTGCLDVEGSYGLSYYDPTIAELREQAAISYFSCVLQPSKAEAEVVLQLPLRRLSPDSESLKLAETMNASAVLQDRLIRALSDFSYEVRLVTLKWLLKFVKSIESSSAVCHVSSSEIKIIQGWIKTNLQEKMMKLLDSEKHHRCTYYILRILFSWNSLQFQKLENKKSANSSYVGNSDFNSTFQFWHKLKSLYKLTRHTKTRETVICCMAICVKHYVSLLTSHILPYPENRTAKYDGSDRWEKSANLFECITFFVELIKEHSSSSEPVNMRKAAAESIIASGLLEQAELVGSAVFCHKIPSKISASCVEQNEAVNMYARQVLDTWFTCIKLLEDEDDEIRNSFVVNVQRSFSSQKFSCSSHAGGVPTQVEKVIELSFRYLSSVFGHWIDYFDTLLQWVLDAANYVVTNGDLVRRVFDKEIDNHHEEKLLICQICCSHLEKLPIIKSFLDDVSSNNEFRNYLYGWRMRFRDQLMSFAKDHIETMGEVDWIGGVGNHKDAFLPLYANLLGFYALSNCIFDGEIKDGALLISNVNELGKTINPFFRNPLISNLFFLIVKSHERNVGAVANMSISEFMDKWMWQGFDPYFLLR